MTHKNKAAPEAAGEPLTTFDAVAQTMRDAATMLESGEQMGGAQVAKAEQIHMLAGGLLKREARSSGGYGWLLYSTGGQLIRALNGYECELVDSARAASTTESAAAPIPMILHCPNCHTQHIDAPDERTPDWKNEPHRSHLCHACGHIWRPADVPTEGVRAIRTKGSNDSESPAEGEAEGEATERKPLTDEQIAAIADRTGFMAKDDVLGNLVGGDICLDFARAIEQHHGITGGGK